MSEGDKKELGKAPKGRKKGGKRFPQCSLKDAVKWADKLVSKTHGGPQADDLIRASVIEAKSTLGNVRISALKQFDLMEGDSKGYSATQLAKDIRSAPQDEKFELYRRAALKPDIFNGIYTTYHGDSVSYAKLTKRAAELQVHPESTGKCVDVYIETMEFAGLLSREGDLLTHVGKEIAEPSVQDQIEAEEAVVDYDDVSISRNDVGAHEEAPGLTRRGVATVQVNINLDSSLDTEKLQKQLELLRRYGAL